MDYAAGAQKQQGLKKGVRHQVEHRSAKSAHAAGHHHITELADGGVSQNPFNVGLQDADGCGIERRDTADDRHNQQRFRSLHINRAGAGDDIDAGGDHGGRVDQRADRRRSQHGVREPDVQRNLGGFPDGPGQQQQADQGEGARSVRVHWKLRGLRKDHQIIQRAEGRVEENQADQKTEVAQAGDDERLLAGIGGILPAEVIPDQKIGTKPDSLPSHPQQQVIAGQNQGQHKEQEEVHVGEEPVDALLTRHIADGIDVDEQPHAGYDQRHDGGKRVEIEIEIYLKIGAGNPGEVNLHAGCVTEAEAGNESEQKGAGNGADGNRGDPPEWKTFPPKPVQGSAKKRKNRDQPQWKTCIHLCLKRTSFA